MARFSGTVGFLTTVEFDPENHPGVWDEEIVEKRYYGDVLSNSRRWDQNGNMNDDLVINNRISIVADKFCKEHLGAMKFVRWAGLCWKITNVEIQHPRLILTIGGEYHEPEQKSPIASTPGVSSWI